MSIHRFFRRRFPLRSRARELAFLCFIVFLSACGGEESVDKSIIESMGDEKSINDVPVSTSYFPMTLGSRWVYRNPDGSKWAREVTESQKIGDHLYHFFSYDPPIEDIRLDFLKTPMYAAHPDRLVFWVKSNDMNEAVWQTILQSGGNDQDWNLSHTFDGRVWQAKRNEKALVYLFHYHKSVVSLNEVALFRFPLVPGESYKALEMKLHGSYDDGANFYSYEADAVISGSVGHPESVETPAGRFKECINVQYEAKLESFETTEFQNKLKPPPKEIQEAYLSLLELNIREELVSLMISIMPELGFETVWLAPGVGPVKIETPNGIAELIDYEVKAVASGQ